MRCPASFSTPRPKRRASTAYTIVLSARRPFSSEGLSSSALDSLRPKCMYTLSMDSWLAVLGSGFASTVEAEAIVS